MKLQSKIGWRLRHLKIRFDERFAGKISPILSKLHLLRNPFWRLPEPPICEFCGLPATSPFYIYTGDSWDWGWDCDPCGPDGFDEDIRIPWPFVVNWAASRDWKRLGFEEA